MEQSDCSAILLQAVQEAYAFVSSRPFFNMWRDGITCLQFSQLAANATTKGSVPLGAGVKAKGLMPQALILNDTSVNYHYYIYIYIYI